MNINVNVSNKVALAVGSPVIVCGNSDYNIVFTFDSEWDDYSAKTARFKFIIRGAIQHIDVLFTGTTCPVPILSNINDVYIGVYAGDLHTTTSAKVQCQKSILCDSGSESEGASQRLTNIDDLATKSEVNIELSRMNNSILQVRADSVPNSREIAGIRLIDDITASDLKNALEIPDTSDLVSNTRTIAGVDLQDDISASELAAALPEVGTDKIANLAVTNAKIKVGTIYPNKLNPNYIDSEPKVSNDEYTHLVSSEGVKNAIDTTKNDIIELVTGVIGDSAECWELGTIDGTTGEPVTATVKQRSKYFVDITAKKNTIVAKSNDANIQFFVVYYDANKDFTYYSGWVTSLTFDSQYAFAKIVIKDTTGATTPSELYTKITVKVTEDKKEIPLRNRLEAQMLNIAYSKIGIAPINTLEHYKIVKNYGFNACKGDVRFTSDGKGVMCHDAGFTLDANGRITTYDSSNATAINTMTFVQCLALEYAEQYGSTYVKVASFEDYIKTCKEDGLIAYITLRNYTNNEVDVTETLRVLDKYSMRYSCVINSFTLATLQAFRDEDEKIILSWVQTGNTVLTTAQVDSLNALGGNDIICMFSFATGYTPWDSGDNAGTISQSAEAIAYAKEKGLLIYQAQISTREDYQKCLDVGFDGMQIKAAFSISGNENLSNKVTTISTSSTDTQYVSAKCVYDVVGNIESCLEALL